MPRSVASGRVAASNRVATQDIKSSLSFNGTSSYTTFSGVRHTSGIFSLGFWVKPYKPKFYQRFVSCRGYTTNGGFELEYVGTDDSFRSIFTSSSDALIGTSGAIRIDRGFWSYIALTVENSTVKTYVNGDLRDTLTLSGVLGSASSQSLTLGRKSYDTSMYALMNMSQFSFESGAVWTTEQIKQRMSQLPLSGTVIARLDEGAGTTAYDSSGNGNHGTITAGTYTSDVPTKKRGVVGGNLVYNGDFEYAPPFTAATTANSRFIDGTAGGNSSLDLHFKWRTNGASNNFTAQYDSVEKKSGSYSMKVSLTNAAGYAGITWGNQNTTSTMIPVLQNTSYTMSGWVKTTGVSPGAARIDMIEYDGALGTPAVQSTTAVGGTTDWTFYTKTFTTGSTTRFIQPRAVLGTGAVSSAWFDDIQLRPTTPVTRGVVS